MPLKDRFYLSGVPDHRAYLRRVADDVMTLHGRIKILVNKNVRLLRLRQSQYLPQTADLIRRKERVRPVKRIPPVDFSGIRIVRVEENQCLRPAADRPRRRTRVCPEFLPRKILIIVVM